MTEFQSLNAQAFAESIDFTGAIPFRLRGAQLRGSITDLTEEQKFEMGQVIPKVVATLEFGYHRFNPPLVNGEKVSMQRDGVNKLLRIGHIDGDEVSIRLTLQDINE